MSNEHVGPRLLQSKLMENGMGLMSLLYFSRSTMPGDEADASIENVVASARSYNPEHGLTGALLFTGEHFAQVLEGTPEAIEALMKSIRSDTRHHQIVVVSHEPITKRRFGEWSMAYSGPSQFVARHVTRLLTNPDAPNQERSAQWLRELMWEFSEGPGAR